MLRQLLAALALGLLVALLDPEHEQQARDATYYRTRMFKFAVYQDFLVVLSVMKMMIIEGMTLCEVVGRVRRAGPVTQLYVASSVALHGALLCDERAVQRLRLKPAPYVPPALHQEQQDLMLL